MHGEAETFIKAIENAQCITVLTGAGMSTESGIPDFRSAGGIWTEDMSRMEAMSRDYYERYPKLFWPKFKELFQMKMTGTFQPNAGHLYLAGLEKRGKDVRVFTQNIDGLHIKAGVAASTSFTVPSKRLYARNAARATDWNTFSRMMCRDAPHQPEGRGVRVYFEDGCRAVR